MLWMFMLMAGAAAWFKGGFPEIAASSALVAEALFILFLGGFVFSLLGGIL